MQEKLEIEKRFRTFHCKQHIPNSGYPKDIAFQCFASIHFLGGQIIYETS